MSTTKDSLHDPMKSTLSERLKKLRSSHEMDKPKRTAFVPPRESHVSRNPYREVTHHKDRIVKEKSGTELLARVVSKFLTRIEVQTTTIRTLTTPLLKI